MAMKKYIQVALVGNPNSGKTSLFNQLTGLKQKIVEYVQELVKRSEHMRIPPLVPN